AARLDREAQHHLSAQRRILAELPVVEPVQRRLVAVEDDLDLLVRAARSRAAAGERAIAAAAGADRARDARGLHACHLRAAAFAAAADVAAQRCDVDAAARAG